ncbi:MAG: [Fe-Fe] hydrogenase large subunit C-terminal domain-containing protein [Clostridia bacterium]
MSKQLHTVVLDADKCKGCVACMKRCPTEAIRVRNGKAKIHYENCVGCGECVRICPHNAKKASYDSFEVIKDPKYKYRVALPAPSLYGQFENLENLNYLLEGFLALGFDDVFEVARGAELISEQTRKYLEQNKVKKPVISTACPAVVELILIRFHNLKDNLLPLLTPADVSARIAREQAVKKTGFSPEEIGIFFISPCPAKVHALKSGMGLKQPPVDGVLSAAELYFLLLDAMKTVGEPRDISQIGVFGLSWATSGGEAASLLKNKYLAADGMENVVNVLKELENGKLSELQFIELNACVSGCVGGILNIENPFVAKAKLRILRKYLPVSKNSLADYGYSDNFYYWEQPPQVQDVLKFDQDLDEAMKKLAKANKVMELLPLLDCGSCGAPSCRAFAEDVSEGEAKLNECHRIDMEKLL